MHSLPPGAHHIRRCWVARSAVHNPGLFLSMLLPRLLALLLGLTPSLHFSLLGDLPAGGAPELVLLVGSVHQTRMSLEPRRALGMQRLVRAETLEEGELGPGFKCPARKASSRADCVAHVMHALPPDSPPLFGAREGNTAREVEGSESNVSCLVEKMRACSEPWHTRRSSSCFLGAETVFQHA